MANKKIFAFFCQNICIYQKKVVPLQPQRNVLSKKKDRKDIVMNNESLTKKLSKAGEWMRDHTEPLFIVNDRAAIEALRV